MRRKVDRKNIYTCDPRCFGVFFFDRKTPSQIHISIFVRENSQLGFCATDAVLSVLSSVIFSQPRGRRHWRGNSSACPYLKTTTLQAAAGGAELNSSSGISASTAIIRSRGIAAERSMALRGPAHPETSSSSIPHPRRRRCVNMRERASRKTPSLLHQPNNGSAEARVTFLLSPSRDDRVV